MLLNLTKQQRKDRIESLATVAALTLDRKIGNKNGRIYCLGEEGYKTLIVNQGIIIPDAEAPRLYTRFFGKFLTILKAKHQKNVLGISLEKDSGIESRLNHPSKNSKNSSPQEYVSQINPRKKLTFYQKR